jgi:hypothetical protein
LLERNISFLFLALFFAAWRQWAGAVVRRPFSNPKKADQDQSLEYLVFAHAHANV